jgi:hypothetical protein
MNSTSLATNLLALLNIHNLHPHRRSSLSIVKSSSTMLSHPMIMDLIFDGTVQEGRLQKLEPASARNG